MQPGDVPETSQDIDDLMRDVGFKPSTPIEVGIARFVEWYRWYRRVEEPCSTDSPLPCCSHIRCSIC